MTSREAFEAALTRAIEEQKDPRFYSTIDAINWAWQAAIQHASDVATAKCAEISEREHLDFKGLNPDAPPGKRGNSYVEGLSDGADSAAFAMLTGGLAFMTSFREPSKSMCTCSWSRSPATTPFSPA